MSGELEPDARREVEAHVRSCPACEAALKAGTHLKFALQNAIRHEEVPTHLQSRIRSRLRESNAGRPWFIRARLLVALAAVLVVGASVGILFRRQSGGEEFKTRAEQDVFIERTSAGIAPVMRIGLGDHIHCAVFRKYPSEPPSRQQLIEDLGPEFSGLLPSVMEKIPGEYRIVLGHKCTYRGHQFVHLAFKSDSLLLSLVVTRKGAGEAFSKDIAVIVRQVSGIPIYQARAGRFEVAGFQAGDFLVYVASNLPQDTNLQIAATLAPSIGDFFSRL